ncbi:MAG TPA: hypothetical protein VIC06_06680 [Solirubrobacteraceae bacterium]
MTNVRCSKTADVATDAVAPDPSTVKPDPDIVLEPLHTSDPDTSTAAAPVNTPPKCIASVLIDDASSVFVTSSVLSWITSDPSPCTTPT